MLHYRSKQKDTYSRRYELLLFSNTFILFIGCNPITSPITAPDFRKFGEADIRDLCEYIGAEIPAKWEDFGRFVGVKDGHLAAIQAENAGKPDWQQSCFTRVFTRWRNGLTSAFTWERAAEALTSNAVSSGWLLATLYNNLEAKK